VRQLEQTWSQLERDVPTVERAAEAAETDEEAEVANRKDVVMQQLTQLADDLEELWKAATRDPAVEQRKQRAWTIFAGVLGAVAAMASRRAVAKLWPILTGEQPPAVKTPGASPSGRAGRATSRA